MTSLSSESPASSPQSFFEVWLPARFAELMAAAAPRKLQLNERCSVQVRVGAGTWLLTIAGEQLNVTPSTEAATDAVSQDPPTFRLRIDERLFERIVLAEAAKVTAVPTTLPPSFPALKLLTLDDEAIALIGEIPGSLELVVVDDGVSRAVTFGPGNRAPHPAACILKCALEDLEAIRRGEAQPMEMFFTGRIQLEGDAQVAMALAGLFL